MSPALTSSSRRVIVYQIKSCSEINHTNIKKDKMSLKTFPQSCSANRIASLTLRVEPTAHLDLVNYYTSKIGFEKAEPSTQTSKISTLSLPQGIFPDSTGHTSCALNLNPEAAKKYCGSNRLDTYWKIGLQLHDVDSAAEQIGSSKGNQFMDIGYLTHISDPAAFTIELLQTTFEGNETDRNLLFGDDKKKKYQQHIQTKVPSLDPSSLAAQQPLTIGQITTRASDAETTLVFYQDVLGMKLMSIQDVSKYGFRLYFLAFTADEPPTTTDLNDVSIREWLWQRRYTQLEIQCTVAPEVTPLTHNGCSTPAEDLHNLPSGLESIQVEINEKIILERVKHYHTFQAAAENQRVRVAAGEDERVLVGSVQDPDGIKIEILTSANVKF